MKSISLEYLRRIKNTIKKNTIENYNLQQKVN